MGMTLNKRREVCSALWPVAFIGFAGSALGEDHGGTTVGQMEEVVVTATKRSSTVPHSGAVITLLAVTGLTHRQSYRDILAITAHTTPTEPQIQKLSASCSFAYSAADCRAMVTAVAITALCRTRS
jgi:hypothetical protein